MTRLLLMIVCLMAPALLAACSSGGGPETAPRAPSTAPCALPQDRALTAAVRAHAGDRQLATSTSEGGADLVEVDACPTSSDSGRGTVTVYGLRDDSVRDARHELTLARRGGRWTVTGDTHSQRCQPGRGHQNFTTEPCV